MFELKIDRISDVVIIPFYECYPASCRFCTIKQKPIGKIGFLSTPIESFRQHIEPSYVERVGEWNADNYIILGGEPTLSAHLIDGVIDPIRERSNGKIILYTNAFLLGRYMMRKGFDERVKSLVYSIDRLVVSIEGSKPYNDYVRGKGMYDLAMFVIEKMKDYLDVVVRIGFSRYNLKYVVEALEQIDVPALLFPRLDSVISEEDAFNLYHYVAGSENRWILLPSFTNFMEEFSGRGEGKPCPAGHMKLNVLPNGEVTPCQWIDHPIATLDMDDDEIEEYANKWVRRAFMCPEECSNCKYKNICLGGCRVARDYRWCPLRFSAPMEGRVMIEGFTKEVKKTKVKAVVKKLEGVVVHGCSAGC